MVEIDAKRALRRALDGAVGAHEIGQRDIAEPGLLLGPGDFGVDGDAVVLREEADELQDVRERLFRRVVGEDRIGDDDGAGVDEGIAGDAALMLQLDDGVEGVARGLAPDAPPQALSAMAEGEGEGEDLRDAPSAVAMARANWLGSTLASWGM
jgi:hypothetical protein